MTVPTLPSFGSYLTQAITANNFTPIQSVQLAATNGSSTSITFTIVPGGSTRTTMKITNRGTKGAYLATGVGAATAVVSSGTPTPASGSGASTCDYIAAGAILTQDYPALTDTIAAICAGSDTTTLEISIGYGQ